MKKILILGVTGQDGSYLADLLLKKKYLVHGLFRKSATGNTKNIDHIINNSKLLSESYVDSLGLINIVSIIEKEFQIEIEQNELILENFDTIDLITNFISSKIL